MGLVNRVVGKYFPANIRAFQISVAAIAAVFFGAVLILGWNSSLKVREVVTKDFNEQQLVIARHAGGQIENSLGALKKEIRLLRLSPSIQYFEKVAVGNRMGITLSSIKEFGALEIQLIERGGTLIHLVDQRGYRTVPAIEGESEYLEWASRKENLGAVLMSEVAPGDVTGMNRKLLMKVVTPVWQVSVDESNPVATNQFSGALVFVIDASALIEKVTKDIRSGKTGYAWVIDEKGTFLYHPETDFIGDNAFEARQKKRTTISFARINEIQKEKMLTGKEGMSWYTSGWHRGREGEMKKLIAYTPIHLDTNGNRLWSVAVVAPVSEVEDAIHSIHIRQIILQAVILASILFGSMIVVTMMAKWSKALETEVARKTVECRQSEQRYRSLVENAEDMIFTVDEAGNFLSINGFGARFLGMSPDKVVGKNLSDIFTWPGAEVPLSAIKEVFKTRRGNQVTHPVKVGDNEYWLNTNFRRLFDESGNIYAVLGISRDITDRKKMEENIYHTEKLASMGTLAAGVAHEINNPLAIILGFTDVLLDKMKPDTDEYNILKTVERHGLRAKGVVENLLSFARYTEHREELVDINEGIHNVLSVVTNTLLMNKVKLVMDLHDNLPLVKGYREELQQVSFNIISNAVAAMNGGGLLKISTGAQEGQVEIRYADNGHGIKEEHRRKIFDPLFTTKKTGEGTGLGLSVCYGIVMKHGGTIGCETRTAEESKETGTTFIVRLPACDGAEAKITRI